MITQLKFLMRLFVFHGSFAFVLWLCTSASASVIDAPHNETHGVKCGDCHAYSLWWQYSPAANNSTYAQITDGVCNKCHASNSSFPKVSHNSVNMGSLHDIDLGPWETKCLDCHNPHYQDQLNWQGADSANLFLVTGTIDAASIQVNSSANTTTLDYKNAGAHANWIDPVLWSKKTTVPGRGLILVITDLAQNTFEINSAAELVEIVSGSQIGAGTITLQGSLPESYKQADTGFAIIYGQLVKKSITTPNSDIKDVKFFDASITYNDIDLVGGTADFTADPVANPPQGICQVCHTKTKYYNNDGLQPPSRTNLTGTPRIAALPHNGSTPCTGCHAIAKGFQPTNADHTFISSKINPTTNTSCAHCHTLADIVTGTHKSKCDDCHTSVVPGLKPDIVAIGKWPSPTPHTTGNCYDCHDGIKNDFTTHLKADDHSYQVTTYNSCVNKCHFHKNKDIIEGIHQNKCESCHNLTGPPPDQAGWLIGKAIGGPGSCATCHGTNVSNLHPGAMDHSTQVTAGTDFCATTCHLVDEVEAGGPEYQEYTDAVTSYWIHGRPGTGCDICHNQYKSYELISLAATNGPGTCTQCHGNDFNLHSIAEFKEYNHTTFGAVTADAVCTQNPLDPLSPPNTCTCCHKTDMITGIHGTPPAGGTSGCENCHNNSDGSLVTRLAAVAGQHTWHTTPGTNPVNTCSTCHQFPSNMLPHPNHTAVNNILPVAECVACHTGDYVEVVHNNDCLSCHTSTIASDIHILQPGILSGGDCITCHVSYNNAHPTQADPKASSFNTHKNMDTHVGQVDGDDPNPAIRSCEACHHLAQQFPDPVWDVHNGNCSNACHITANGPQKGHLIGSASAMATGKPPGGSNYCADCHTHPKYLDPDLHNAAIMPVSCNYCHE